jgi:hypothetical protein
MQKVLESFSGKDLNFKLSRLIEFCRPFPTVRAGLVRSIGVGSSERRA